MLRGRRACRTRYEDAKKVTRKLLPWNSSLQDRRTGETEMAIITSAWSFLSVACVSIVCLSTRISRKPHRQTSPNLLLLFVYFFISLLSFVRSTPQTDLRSVQPFVQSTSVWPLYTVTQATPLCSYSPHLALVLAMRSNDNGNAKPILHSGAIPTELFITCIGIPSYNTGVTNVSPAGRRE